MLQTHNQQPEVFPLSKVIEMAALRVEASTGEGGQQISQNFDIERQVARLQIAISSKMSQCNPLQRLVNRCRSSFPDLARMQRGIGIRLQKLIRDGQDHASAPFSIGLERPLSMNASLYEKAGQCCFLCLEKRDAQIAVPVPCFRPVEARQVKYTTQKLGSPTRKTVYHAIRPKESVRESDTAIFERLNWACFKYQGVWKQWIPFYGITKVREVTVSFALREVRCCLLPLVSVRWCGRNRWHLSNLCDSSRNCQDRSRGQRDRCHGAGQYRS